MTNKTETDFFEMLSGRIVLDNVKSFEHLINILEYRNNIFFRQDLSNYIAFSVQKPFTMQIYDVIISFENKDLLVINELRDLMRFIHSN